MKFSLYGELAFDLSKCKLPEAIVTYIQNLRNKTMHYFMLLTQKDTAPFNVCQGLSICHAHCQEGLAF